MENEFINSSSKEFARMRLVHLGKIISNLAIAGLTFCIVNAASQLFIAYFVVLGVMFMIATLGLVFAFVPNYWQIITSPLSLYENFFSKIVPYVPYVLGISIALSVVSIVLLSFDKYQKHTARIVFSAIVVLLSILVVTIFLTGGKA